MTGSKCSFPRLRDRNNQRHNGWCDRDANCAYSGGKSKMLIYCDVALAVSFSRKLPVGKTRRVNRSVYLLKGKRVFC